MNSEMATKVRISGLVRSPDREGALAHFDPERGFVLVARSSMGVADVIDPTIWVREKIALALAVPGEGEPPLRRSIAALRSIHAELMARSERERAWVSALVALFHDEEGAAILAGDCPCYRFREGLLARLGRIEPRGAGVPAGSLGSETQVRIEVVPLRTRPGDCYIFATDPLSEGELARLSRELASAQDDASLLRRAAEGSPGKGRVVVVAHRGGRALSERVAAESAEERFSATEAEVDAALGTLSLEPLDAALHAEAPGAAAGVPGALARGAAQAPGDAAGEDAYERADSEPAVEDVEAAGAGPEPAGAEARVARAQEGEPAGRASAAAKRASGEEAPPGRPRPLAPLHEERPWYEPLALWGAGALAIVALALLVRSIVPGILGAPRERPVLPPAAAPPTPSAAVDIYSDPPGALLRLDGVATSLRTPVTAYALDPGVHKVELSWGAFGSWSDTVEVKATDHLTLHPRVTAPVSFRSSDASRLLDVFLDGAYAGSTPLALDSVTVGRHLVRFAAPGLSASAQEFELSRGTPLELVGSAGPVPHTGTITVRTALLGDDGYQPGKGDPVWVDGDLRGVTPFTVTLPPGTHSVRVVRRGFPAQVSVLEVRPAGDHFVTAEFGARSEEPIVFTPPLSLSLQNPAPLTITLPEAVWDETVTAWLYAAPPGGSFQARSMTQLDGQEHAFSALVPREVLANAARRVRVYFRVVGASGREYCSEIRTIPVKS